jgi:hypothetical protein
MNHYPQDISRFSCTINPSVFEQWYNPQPGHKLPQLAEQLECKEWHSGFNAVTWIYRYKRETRPGDVEVCHYCHNLQPCNIQETTTDPLYFCSDTVTCAYLAWYRANNYPVPKLNRPINLRATVWGDKGIYQIMNYDVLELVDLSVLPQCAKNWAERAKAIKGELQ